MRFSSTILGIFVVASCVCSKFSIHFCSFNCFFIPLTFQCSALNASQLFPNCFDYAGNFGIQWFRICSYQFFFIRRMQWRIYADASEAMAPGFHTFFELEDFLNFLGFSMPKSGEIWDQGPKNAPFQVSGKALLVPSILDTSPSAKIQHMSKKNRT